MVESLDEFENGCIQCTMARGTGGDFTCLMLDLVLVHMLSYVTVSIIYTCTPIITSDKGGGKLFLPVFVCLFVC